MNVNGGHEFVCKRCKKPLDVDVSILARLDSFDDLDKTLEMMVPSSYATSPTSSLLFSKGSKAATFKHSPSFVKRSSGGSGSSRSASPSPSSGGGEREKDVCVSDSGFELLLPERTPLPIDSSAPSSLSSSTAGSTSTSPPSSPSLGSSSSVAHSLPPHLTSTLSAPLMRKNPPAASTPSSSSSSPSASSSSSSQGTTQARPFSGYGSGTYAASIPLSQRRSNYSSSNNSNVFSSSSSIATLSTTATKRKKKNVPAHSMTKLLEVFEQTSEMTEMDHPLCAGCTESVLVELEEELEEAYKENLSYERYLQALSLEEREEGGGIGAGEKEKGDGGEEDEEKPEEEGGEEEDERRKKKEEEEQQSMATSPYLNRIQRVDAEIKQLEDEEKALKEQLLMIEAERKQLEDEEQDLKRDQAKIEDIERRYWENYNEFQAKLHAFQEERDAVKMSIEKANSQLELLKKTNVYNDAFHVWHDGHFGTINGRRLGTLPSQQVPWDEINAAWGQATLLLYTIAKQLNFTFSSFRLVPMGSSSKVIKLEDESEYELYGANDYKVLKVFWFRRFDTAMMGFLKCLKELGDYVESEDKRFRLPYRMDRDKIGKMSIKNQFNSPETWTKALKYTLTNLKWLLAWMARRQ